MKRLCDESRDYPDLNFHHMTLASRASALGTQDECA